MPKIIFIIFFIIIFTGCSTTRRALEESRNTIEQLKQVDAERTARNTELERLLESERSGNLKLERIINGYVESEKYRIEEEKRIIDSLQGIFGEGSEIIENLKLGYDNIRKYFESQESME